MLGVLAGLMLVVGGLALIGPGPASAASAADGKAYVTNYFSNDVSVIDTSTNTVVATVAVGSNPQDVAVTPDGSRAYVVNTGEDTVSVIDTATNMVVATILLAGGSAPTGVALTPDGTRAYVTNTGSDTVSVIDTATNTVVATVAVGAGPQGVAVTPDGTRVYTANNFDSTVSVIDTATNTVVATVAVGASPRDVAVSPDGTRAYVNNLDSNTVSVIDTATNTVVATVAVVYPGGVAVSPDGARAYVTSGDTNTVSVIDTATNTVVATVPVGASPFAVAVSPDGTRAYVTNLGSNTVSVIDTATNTVVATVGVDSFPIAVAVRPAPHGKATPTIATQASPGNLLGAPVHDTATVSGGASPTGTVTFQLFSDAGCATQVFTSTNPLGSGTATSDTFTPAAAGTYRFIASYSGDASNSAVTSACGAANESVVIAPFSPPPFSRTITGDFLGPLTVNAGESVLITNARVVGPVTVNPGGALTVVNSQISGGIVANGPSFFSVCGSQVSGPSTTPGRGIVVSNAAVPPWRQSECILACTPDLPGSSGVLRFCGACQSKGGDGGCSAGHWSSGAPPEAEGPRNHHGHGRGGRGGVPAAQVQSVHRIVSRVDIPVRVAVANHHLHPLDRVGSVHLVDQPVADPYSYL
ncbi:MAG: beta-propeller fold lactonase family protein [Actinobacteria bacterium]|nr:beta-propeller fold lactonase family protein [Actinomycetota bacterium]